MVYQKSVSFTLCVLSRYPNLMPSIKLRFSFLPFSLHFSLFLCHPVFFLRSNFSTPFMHNFIKQLLPLICNSMYSILNVDYHANSFYVHIQIVILLHFFCSFSFLANLLVLQVFACAKNLFGNVDLISLLMHYKIGMFYSKIKRYNAYSNRKNFVNWNEISPCESIGACNE